ncbi:MAG: hypothetical protein BWY32_02677 [bacterium ADurb.Bin243]|nr:MAG: hypothetical protein BWY32_02677 [bacterium ADurb.Bin243]
MTDSTITSASFMINIPLPQVAAPVISPNGGTFSSTQSVTLTSATADAIIKYTLDGSTPSASNGSVYSTAISLIDSKTIKAIATKAGMTDSTVTSASFSISIPLEQAAAPTFSVAEGTFDATQSVVLSSLTAGASIYYTTDGSVPTSSSVLYSSAISVGVNTTLKAIAIKSGMTSSTVASAAYNIRAAAPSFSPAAGSFSSAQNVTITSATPGVTIKYTTDSSTPSSTNGLTYSSPISLGTTTTVKAIAIKSGMTDSNVSTALYSITIYSGGGGTPPADTTPPTFAATYPKTATVATTTLDLKVQSSESGTAYYVILADGASAPIAAQVKNGTDASNGALAANLKGSLALTANTEATANITGLTAGTAYDIYVVAQDSSSNLQASPVKVDVTTVASSPAFSSVVASNAGSNIGLGVNDNVVITFDQNTNKPAITAANLNTWLVLSGGHSWGTALVDGDIVWNGAGNVLTITFSDITGSTIAVGDTVTLNAAANIKDAAATAAASTAVSAASTGSFTSSPVFSSVVASNAGSNIGLGVNDNVVITFDQNTNKPAITAANLNTWLVLSGGHSWGTALVDGDIVWNGAGNVLTITFSDITGSTIAVGDTVTLNAAANIKDADATTVASTAVSAVSTGSF